MRLMSFLIKLLQRMHIHEKTGDKRKKSLIQAVERHIIHRKHTSTPHPPRHSPPPSPQPQAPHPHRKWKQARCTDAGHCGWGP